MDLRSIEKKYPKSYKLAESWVWRENANTRRDLYDFFDENGIIGFVSYNQYYDKYLPHIKQNNAGYANIEFKPLNTRTEAEEELFEKCFGILENKLGE
jgi:hypothetical protein